MSVRVTKVKGSTNKRLFQTVHEWDIAEAIGRTIVDHEPRFAEMQFEVRFSNVGVTVYVTGPDARGPLYYYIIVNAFAGPQLEEEP